MRLDALSCRPLFHSGPHGVHRGRKDLSTKFPPISCLPLVTLLPHFRVTPSGPHDTAHALWGGIPPELESEGEPGDMGV